MEDPLDRLAADLAHRDRVVAHPLHHLEGVAVGAAVFVGRHELIPESIIWRGPRPPRRADAWRAGDGSARRLRCIPRRLRPSGCRRACCMLSSGGWGAVRSVSVERRAVCQRIHAVRCRPARRGMEGTSRSRAKLVSCVLSLVQLTSNDLTRLSAYPRSGQISPLTASLGPASDTNNPHRNGENFPKSSQSGAHRHDRGRCGRHGADESWTRSRWRRSSRCASGAGSSSSPRRSTAASPRPTTTATTACC